MKYAVRHVKECDHSSVDFQQIEVHKDLEIKASVYPNAQSRVQLDRHIQIRYLGYIIAISYHGIFNRT